MKYRLLKEAALQELAEEDSLCTQSENELGETIGEFLDRKGYDGEERRFLADHLAGKWHLNEDDTIDDPDFHDAWDDARSELMLMYANGVWHR